MADENVSTSNISGDTVQNGPSVEESYKQLVEEGIISEDGTVQTENTKDAEADKPASSLDKFKDPKTGKIDYEKLEKSYLELEKRQGKPKVNDDDDGEGDDDDVGDDDGDEIPEPSKADRELADKVTQEAGLDLSEVSQEWWDNGGKLSDGTFEKFENAGYPREAVETWINGLVYGNMTTVNGAYEIAGGADEYHEMLDWAIDNLPEDEQEAFDKAVNSGNRAMTLQAVRGLHAQYARANDDGTLEPENTTEGRPSAEVNTYKFIDEYMADLNDPRYETSESFRQKVAAKLDKSDIL